MATVIHEHEEERPQIIREYHHDTDDTSGVGAIIATLAVLILLAVLLFYGLPYLRNAANRQNTPASINVNLTAPNSGGTNTGGGTSPANPAP